MWLYFAVLGLIRLVVALVGLELVYLVMFCGVCSVLDVGFKTAWCLVNVAWGWMLCLIVLIVLV